MIRVDELIPHRAPFLLVSEIVALDPAVSGRGRWHLSGEEEFFAGHFPGNPVLPGVLMVESLAQLAAAVVLADERYKDRLPLFGGIDRARFRRQVVPGDVLDLEVSIGRLRRGRAVATGSRQLAARWRAKPTCCSCSLRAATKRVLMRIATWNVNSMRARIEHVEEWLAQLGPDVCCFQETKLADDAFPFERFRALGYEVAHHGDGRWNGVTIASRVGLADIDAALPAAAKRSKVPSAGS